VAPDVFGPKGWFGTRGLGFEAWRALVIVEERNSLTRDEVAVALGTRPGRIVDRLVDLNLATYDPTTDRYYRGPSTLVEVARTLRTLGTRTWKAARHREEQRCHREKLEAIPGRCAGRRRAMGGGR